MLRECALLVIRFYQRNLSRHKGFHCAYRVGTGGASCSQLGFRAIRRYGFFAGILLLNQRLKYCGAIHREYYAQPVKPWAYQRGDCDLGCDSPCEPEALGCCDGCDWPSRKKKQPQPKRRRLFGGNKF
ncbi:membrane protein insertion efficiency factor YidD [Chitinibacter sp. SCUT-21]|uniref:membrane protein insertion efficiency factor YidD n=1 Tax=Chitinibacter sp. SCUT-21 TaxID=2970891 RepID=UPI0035A571BE